MLRMISNGIISAQLDQNLPNATDIPIPIQNLGINELGMFWILEIWLDDVFAKVDLVQVSSSLRNWCFARLTPGSTVMTLPAGRFLLTLRYLNKGSGSE